MGQRIHVSLSVRGALQMKARELRMMFRKPDGKRPTVYEAREYLMEELAKGHERIALSEECVGFDPVSGCPGHEIPNP